MSEYLAIAQEAARKAANVTMDYYTRKLTVSIKKDRTPVTDADHAAEKIIIDTIMRKFPDHAFYGEETGRTGESNEFMWLIDPIDGTKNFIAEIPLWGILIALMHKGEIIVGVSYLPILGEMLCAEKGEGAFVNGENIHVSKTTKMAKGMISFGSLGAFKKAGLDQQALAGWPRPTGSGLNLQQPQAALFRRSLSLSPASRGQTGGGGRGRSQGGGCGPVCRDYQRSGRADIRSDRQEFRS
jgi:histidinol-phosphatase